ncbi:MAG: hypothetical protein E6I90_02425 [Chloroflexi bacterium]|nr:MAG: hypothetical protein E6I90_02425 [Chloroflexota bacterium]
MKRYKRYKRAEPTSPTSTWTPTRERPLAVVVRRWRCSSKYCDPSHASFSRGHHLDKDALRAALETNARYIGMIGSPSKVKHIFKDLLKEGFTRSRLAQVHAPIGLDLGAETPDEIALSIAAEMVMIRKKATGAPLNTLHQLLTEEEAAVEEVPAGSR